MRNLLFTYNLQEKYFMWLIVQREDDMKIFKSRRVYLYTYTSMSRSKVIVAPHVNATFNELGLGEPTMVGCKSEKALPEDAKE